jgi:hypothetical protein
LQNLLGQKRRKYRSSLHIQLTCSLVDLMPVTSSTSQALQTTRLSWSQEEMNLTASRCPGKQPSLSN